MTPLKKGGAFPDGSLVKFCISNAGSTGSIPVREMRSPVLHSAEKGREGEKERDIYVGKLA